MAIGVSYFGNRILRHVAADMEDLVARGFTGVLHTFSENDLFYYREQLAAIVAVSQQVGLTVQVNPWGLGHMFGGEAESRFLAENPEVGQVLSDGRRIGAGCPNQPAFRAFVRSWATAAVETGAEHVFWDEPHWAHPARFSSDGEAWGCRCERCREGFSERFGSAMPDRFTEEVRAFREAAMIDFLAEMVGHVADAGGRNTVCLLPLTDGPLGLDDWDAVAGLRGLDVLATDPYWRAFDRPVARFVDGFSDRLTELGGRHGVGAQLWIQGFGLGPEDADDIRTAVSTARAAGIDDLWTWGYEACGHMPSLGTREPRRVWQVLCEALTAPASGSRDEPEQALATLTTESVRPALADLDLWETAELVELLLDEHVRAATAATTVVSELATVVDLAAERFERGGRLIYVGAGTAGRLGVLDAAECVPTFGTPADRVLALLAGGRERAVEQAVEGAEDDDEAGRRDAEACQLGHDDVLVAISASGRTPYVLGAVEVARRAGALTVGLAGNARAELSQVVDHGLEVPAGPEPLAGSTRLKAGTAQKAVLNTLSTAMMVRAGKTLGNLMVDVRASNDKLRDRARRIVTHVAGVDAAAADAALDAADGQAKVAIVTLRRGIAPAEARELLAAARGRLRPVLEA